jgi:hypothetical protein
MKSLLLLLALLLGIVGCTSDHPPAYKLPTVEKQKREKLWESGRPISSKKEIMGTWRAKRTDMADGEVMTEWGRAFNEGNDTEEYVTGKWATGEVIYYKISKSKLYTRITEKDEWYFDAEIRLQGQSLLMKKQKGIYVFQKID